MKDPWNLLLNKKNKTQDTLYDVTFVKRGREIITVFICFYLLQETLEETQDPDKSDHKDQWGQGDTQRWE